MNKEILWNIVNSGLAGLLVFFGGCASGDISWKVIAAAGFAAIVVALIKFQEYWKNEEQEYKDKTALLFTFVH